jgi:hypothetical protein
MLALSPGCRRFVTASIQVYCRKYADYLQVDFGQRPDSSLII